MPGSPEEPPMPDADVTIPPNMPKLTRSDGLVVTGFPAPVAKKTRKQKAGTRNVPIVQVSVGPEVPANMQGVQAIGARLQGLLTDRIEQFQQPAGSSDQQPMGIPIGQFNANTDQVPPPPPAGIFETYKHALGRLPPEAQPHEWLANAGKHSFQVKSEGGGQIEVNMQSQSFFITKYGGLKTPPLVRIDDPEATKPVDRKGSHIAWGQYQTIQQATLV